MKWLPGVGLAFCLAFSACTAAPGPKFPPLSFTGAPAMGAKEARVVVMEFSDFHCPFCRRHATTVLPKLKSEYVDTGQVLYVFRHFPLDIHPGAPAAAVAAACAARQGKFWELHDRFFAAPRGVSAADIDGDIAALSINQPQLRACEQGEGKLTVQQDMAEGHRLQVDGTPAFVLGTNRGGESMSPVSSITGADTYETFAREIEKLLKSR